MSSDDLKHLSNNGKVRRHSSGILSRSFRELSSIDNDLDEDKKAPDLSAVVKTIKTNDSEGFIKKFGDYFANKISARNVQYLHDLSPKFKFSWAILIIAGFIATIIVVFYYAYKSAQQTTFVSFSSNIFGTNCNTIPIPVSGTFLLSKDGIYQGFNGFRYSNALYALQLNDFTGNITASV